MPISPEDDPKLQKLDAELKSARAEYEKDYNPQPEKSKYESNAQDRVGYEFLAHVIAGGLIGFGIDKFFETAPWGLMFMIIMGFVSGIYRANKVMQKNPK